MTPLVFTIVVARVDPDVGRPVAAVWRRTVSASQLEKHKAHAEAWAREGRWRVCVVPRAERNPLAVAKAIVAAESAT